MKIFILLNIFLALSHGSPWDATSSSFVRNYYTQRNIRNIVVFQCWDPHDSFEFARSLMKDLDTRISLTKIKRNLDMERILKVNYHPIGIVVDYDCSESQIVFHEFSKNHLPYNESYHWLLIMENTTLPTEVLVRLPLTIETEITVAERKQKNYVLFDVYNPSYRHDGKLNVTFKGTWSPQDLLKDKLTQYKYLRRGDLHGLRLNLSIILNGPVLPDLQTYLTKPINRHLDTMTRYHYALILQLRDAYNFTINLKQSKSWGYLINGTWNGILADMIDGLVDISASPLQYKAERMDVCEFTVETLVVRICYFFRHPKKSDLRNPFLKPFVPLVWYFIAAVAIICLIALFVTTKLEKKYYHKIMDDASNPEMLSPIDVILVAAISQQGTSVVPRIISGRIVFITIFLWGLLLFQFYSASIVGSLLAQPPRFITTGNDLADSNIDVWVHDVLYLHDFFQTTTQEDALSIYKNKLKPTNKRPGGSFTNIVNGMNLVKKGGYAFAVDAAAANELTRTFSEDEICDLQEIALTEPKKVSITTSKKSPFKKMIIYGLRRMVQHGITEALRKIWIATLPVCPESHKSKPVPVEVKEFSPAVFCLLIGSTAAIFVMIVERCYENINTKFHPEVSPEKSASEETKEPLKMENVDENINYEIAD